MRYTVVKSVLYLWGRGWYNQPIAMQKDLSSHDLENIKERGDGIITREVIDEWLCSNFGDFSSVDDFAASISYEDVDIEIPWNDEENEVAYNDATYGENY